eukprot:g34669.t1
MNYNISHTSVVWHYIKCLLKIHVYHINSIAIIKPFCYLFIEILAALRVGNERFGDGYMITVRTKASLYVKEVVRFFNRNFPEAVLK